MKHRYNTFFGLYTSLLVFLPALPSIASAEGDLDNPLTSVQDLEDFANRGFGYPADLLYPDCGVDFVAMNPPQSMLIQNHSIFSSDYPRFSNFVLLSPYSFFPDRWDYTFPVVIGLEPSLFPTNSTPSTFTNLVFWNRLFGYWNNQVSSLWRGSHAPIFQMTSKLSTPTFPVQWWTSSNSVNECWQFKGESAILQFEIAVMDFRFLCHVYRYSYQGGDDWEYCTVASYVDYLKKHSGDYPSSDRPFVQSTIGRYSALPSSFSTPVLFGESTRNYFFLQRVMTTNTFTGGFWE